MEKNEKKLYLLLIVFSLTLLAILIRSYGLSEWPLHHDEYFTFNYAKNRYQNLFNPALMQERGRKHVIENYSLERIVDMWETTYGELLGNKRLNTNVKNSDSPSI